VYQKGLTDRTAEILNRPFLHKRPMEVVEMMKVEAYKISQKGKDLYVTVLKAKDLIDHSDIDRWSKDRQEGYQRALADARVQRATKYLLEEDALYPTSILVNVRGPLKFKAEEELEKSIVRGSLTIPDEALPLWIVDGQHRRASIERVISEHPDFADYPLPVSIFNLGNTFDEMRMFYVVNSRQKSVPTDLALHHLYRTMEKEGLHKVMRFEPEQRVLAAQALDIVKALSTDARSPWLGRVQAPNEAKGKNHVIKERPLADSIAYVLKELTPGQLDEIRNKPAVLAEPLIDYWNAIKEIFPEAFASPQDYNVQRTPGAYSLHMIYLRLLKLSHGDKAEKRTERFRATLANMFEDVGKSTGFKTDSDFWDKKNGPDMTKSTSMKGMKALATMFLEHLPEPSE